MPPRYKKSSKKPKTGKKPKPSRKNKKKYTSKKVSTAFPVTNVVRLNRNPVPSHRLLKLHWDAGGTFTTAVGARNSCQLFLANSPRLPDVYAHTAKSATSCLYYTNYLSSAAGKWSRYTVHGCRADVRILGATPSSYGRVYAGFCTAANAGQVTPTTVYPSTITSMPMVQGKTIESIGDAQIVRFSQYINLRHLTGESKIEYNSNEQNKAQYAANPVNELNFFIGGGQFDDGAVNGAFFPVGLSYAYEIRLTYLLSVDELNI